MLVALDKFNVAFVTVTKSTGETACLYSKGIALQSKDRSSRDIFTSDCFCFINT